MSSSARRVMYVQYTNPGAYPPLQHSAAILADDGFEVTFLGTRAEGDPLVMNARTGVVVRTCRPSARGWGQKLHYARFAAWAIASAVRERPEWVYASDPLSCPVAVVLGSLLGIRVIYHEHDAPEAASGSAFMRLVLAARRRVVAQARLCVVPNETRANAFARDFGGIRPEVVWNCPGRDEVAAPRRASAPDRLRVLYHGSIVPERLPLSVVGALASLPASVSLVCAGYETAGAIGYVERLRDEAARLGVADRVEFTGPMARGRLLQLCAGCDVGLALVAPHAHDGNLDTLVGASNKAFEYLATGLAVVVSDAPDWRETFVAPGYGLACDPASANSVSSAIRWLLDHPADRAAMGEAGRRRVLNEWNYETAFARVLATLRDQQSEADARRH